MTSTPAKWKPDAIAAKTLDDGFTYYVRLLEFPYAAFYRYRTKGESQAIGEVVAQPVMFTIAVHKSLLGKKEWQVIGQAAPDPDVRRPRELAMFNDPLGCKIIDEQNMIRRATLQECEGLEPAAVWEPEHVADRVQDAFAGRPNHWLDQMRQPLG
jgi:hypothetical protein